MQPQEGVRRITRASPSLAGPRPLREAKQQSHRHIAPQKRNELSGHQRAIRVTKQTRRTSLREHVRHDRTDWLAPEALKCLRNLLRAFFLGNREAVGGTDVRAKWLVLKQG